LMDWIQKVWQNLAKALPWCRAISDFKRELDIITVWLWISLRIRIKSQETTLMSFIISSRPECPGNLLRRQLCLENKWHRFPALVAILVVLQVLVIEWIRLLQGELRLIRIPNLH
jgi:hypothetical protein